MKLPARIGVLGCGSVSHQYLPNLLTSPLLTVASVADVDSATAAAVADRYEVGARSVDALINDPEIDILVNLTPITAHVPVTLAALTAGKHVYTEKSLATTVEDAKAVLAAAAANNRVVCGAPDTLLGTSFQSARQTLESGAVGKPLTAVAVMLRSRVPRPAYFEEHKAFFDMAPYYVSALASLLGPISSVSGYIEQDQVAGAAEMVGVGVSGVLEFASGTSASLSLNWGAEHRSEIPVVEVFADRGIVRLGNPNAFGDPAYVRRHDDPRETWQEIRGSRQPDDWASNLRGFGVTEMVDALANDRPPRASGELACHVVDVIEGLVRSSTSGERVAMTTTCTPPEPLSDSDRNGYINLERTKA